MVYSSERWPGGGESLTRESRGLEGEGEKQAPGLFRCLKNGKEQQVGRVVMASVNENKVRAWGKVMDEIPGLVFGEEYLPLEPRKVEGEEEDWANAYMVAIDKVQTMVKQMEGEDGPSSLVVASDVVVWIDGEPYHNLSREQNLTSGRLEEEVNKLQEVFSKGKGTRVDWDVAMAASRPGGGKVAVGVRYVVDFSPIPTGLIGEAFWRDIPKALGRNTRVGLIDEFGGYVNLAQMVGLNRVFKEGLGAREEEDAWRFFLQPVEELSLVEAGVIGGVPFGGKLEEFLNYPPRGENGSYHLL